jgi:CheY-like chemotaxis protein
MKKWKSYNSKQNKKLISNFDQNSQILIIDDDTFSVFSLKTILANIFYLKADFAYSGADGIKAVEDKNNTIFSSQMTSKTIIRNYKLIFMDLNMPEMNGIETT